MSSLFFPFRILICFIFLIPLFAISQEPSLDWIRTYQTGRSASIATDPDGNIYVLSSHERDILITKLNSLGEEVWNRTYNGPANDWDSPIQILYFNDYLYIIGRSHGIGTGEDVVLLKYSRAGAPMWSRRYNGGANLADIPVKMAIDQSSGEIVITGYSYLEPRNSEIIIVKYNQGGDQLWLKRFNRFRFIDAPSDLVVSPSGDIIVVGKTEREDNPIRPADGDYFTFKYAAAGTLLWRRYFNFGLTTTSIPTNDAASDVGIDEAGNIYVVGERENFATLIKYTHDGTVGWRIDRPWRSNGSPQLAVFNSSNICIANDNQDATAQIDIYSYNSTGVQLWNSSYIDRLRTRIYLNSIKFDRHGSLHLAVNGPSSYQIVLINLDGSVNWVADSRITSRGRNYQLSSLHFGAEDQIYIGGYHEESFTRVFTFAAKYSYPIRYFLIPDQLRGYEYFHFSSYANYPEWCWSGLNLDWKIIAPCLLPPDCLEPFFKASLIQDQKVVWEEKFNTPFKSQLPFSDQLNRFSLQRETKEGFNEIISVDENVVKNGFASLQVSTVSAKNVLHIQAETVKGITVPLMVSLNNKAGKTIWSQQFTAPMNTDLVKEVKEAGSTLKFSVPVQVTQFKVFPNPFSGEVNIDVASEANLTGEMIITDLKGKEMIRRSLNTSGMHTIKTADLKSGLYVLIFRVGGKETRKLIEASK